MGQNFCGQCGAKLPGDVEHCPNCNARVYRPSPIATQDSPDSVQAAQSAPIPQCAPAVPQGSPEDQSVLSNHPVAASASTEAAPYASGTSGATLAGGGETAQQDAGGQGKIVIEIPKISFGGASPTIAGASPMFPLLIIDIALLLMVTFTPWIGSYYFGGSLSYPLPKIAYQAIAGMGKLSQVSGYLGSNSAGSLYQAVGGWMTFIAVVAGFGWAWCVFALCVDAKSDYKGERASGFGAKSVAIVALIVAVTVAICLAYIKAELQNQYFDFGSIVSNAINVTSWVYISIVAGIAAHFYRKSVYAKLDAAGGATQATGDM